MFGENPYQKIYTHFQMQLTDDLDIVFYGTKKDKELTPVEVEALYKQIDEALDNKDKEKFLELTAQLPKDDEI